MRRARIKALATVPVRRKHLQDSVNSVSSDANKLINEEPAKKNDTSNDAISNETKENKGQPNKPVELHNQNTNEKKTVHSTSKDVNSNLSKLEVEDKQSDKTEEINKGSNQHVENKMLKNYQESEQSDKTEKTDKALNHVDLKIIDKFNNAQESKHLNKIETKEIRSIQYSDNKMLDNVQRPKQFDKIETNDKISVQHVDGSPMKAFSNRLCFMRPIPRLDGPGRVRRNSIQGSGASASESEDDSKRIVSVPNRVRNDSICSVQSNKDVSGNPNSVSKSPIGPKRRMFVSESARKLAEARREFMLKHDNKVHDKSKLTMYDLIYYNPTSNPMKKQANGTKQKVMKTVSVLSTDEEQVEENVDEPSAMPVPQVKVGPNGQLIIDEQSLVIEQTKSAIDRSEILIDDENSGGGFYKRRKVRKEWSKWETLKFYKALNTFGTDFLLMQSLFPKRTRQELKLKFKREEKMNRKLVEKALMYQEFDIDLLQKELAIFEENEKKELEGQKSEKRVNSKKDPKPKIRKRKRCNLITQSIESMDTDDENENDLEEEGERRKVNRSIENPNSEKEMKKEDTKKKRSRLDKTQQVALNLDEENSYEDTDSETEIYKPKPTRSGRVPKARKLQAPEINTLDSQFVSRINSETNQTERESPHRTLDDIRNIIPDIGQIEPGSLVILSKEAVEEPGKSILQVYMVNPNYDCNDPNSAQNITPINLTPELLATVTTRMTEVDAIPMKRD